MRLVILLLGLILLNGCASAPTSSGDVLLTSTPTVVVTAAASTEHEQLAESSLEPSLTDEHVTTVNGIVTYGPVCNEDASCSFPALEGVIVVFDRHGNEATRWETNKRGNFHGQLAPGTYTLVPQSLSGIQLAFEESVVIADGPSMFMELGFDTGKRNK